MRLVRRRRETAGRDRKGTIVSEKTDDAVAEADHGDIMYPHAIPFVLVHLSCFAAIWTGITWQALVICVVLYWLRIFFIGAGYHR